MPQAGWYPDPSGTPNTMRYWDGNQWTQQTMPASSAPSTPSPVQAASSPYASPYQGGISQAPSYPSATSMAGPGSPFPSTPAPKKKTWLPWTIGGSAVLVVALVASYFVFFRGTPGPTPPTTPTSSPTVVTSAPTTAAPSTPTKPTTPAPPPTSAKSSSVAMIPCPASQPSGAITDGWASMPIPAGWTSRDYVPWSGCGAEALTSTKEGYFSGSIEIGRMPLDSGIEATAMSIWNAELDRYGNIDPANATLTQSHLTELSGKQGWMVEGHAVTNDGSNFTVYVKIIVIPRPDGYATALKGMTSLDDTSTQQDIDVALLTTTFAS